MTFARRRRLLLVVAVCVWGGVWARALQLQILHVDDFVALRDGQTERRVCLYAPRGEIVDRAGRLLGINVAVRSYFAYPDRETPLATLARSFAPVRERTVRSLLDEWGGRSDRFTWMVRRCGADDAATIEQWNLPGVYGTWEYERVYPTERVDVCDPIGFVNDTLGGAAGLEGYYDSLLTGVNGEGAFVADANGKRFAVDPVAGRPPIPGSRLTLTLDAHWQAILAEELKAAVDKWRAKSGLAILLDPYTGAILAMADVDPKRLPGTRVLKNRLVSDVFEPGSTFKVVPYAAALSDGVVLPHNYFDGGNGAGTFSGHTIRDDKRHGVLSVAEGFAVSSNVVTGRVANRLQAGRLDFWARRFGFGEAAQIDLPGESPGRIAIQKHSEFNIATRSIGHGISVTPVQLAMAYAAVANGGYRVRPHLVSAVEALDGTVRPYPVKAERILRPEIACMLADFMRHVVTEGTARIIADSLFPIAGKTGTAEKPNPQTGQYDKNKFMASFVGFYPADRPRLLGLVVLDEPEPIHYGGYTAAPVLLNTIRRGVAAGGLPDRDMRRLCAADTGDGRDANWSRRLVEAVGPLIATAQARTDSPPVPQPASPVRHPAVRRASSGPTGWNRLLRCAQDGALAAQTAAAADTVAVAPVAADSVKVSPTPKHDGGVAFHEGPTKRDAAVTRPRATRKISSGERQ